MTRTRTSVVRLAVAAATLVAVAVPAAQATDSYEIDPVHSDVTFKVRHLVSYVTGHFRDFSGVIEIDRENLANSSVSLSIVASSIDTANEKRDDHLRSDEFFDTGNFSKITFKSTSMKKQSGDTYTVTGTFSMHGVEQEVSVPAQVLGFTEHQRFGKRAGFTTSFKLDRKDYGIDWNLPMDAGTLVLGNEISVEINIEAFVAQSE